MVHAYLIQIDEEDGDNYQYHGPNFVIKMDNINRLAKLNMTVS